MDAEPPEYPHTPCPEDAGPIISSLAVPPRYEETLALPILTP